MRNKKLFLALVCLLCTFSITTFAQQRQVSGKVSSTDDQPLAGVSVVNKTTNKASQTNASGNFSITASPTDSLLFSYIGYADKTVLAGDAGNLTIKLSVSNGALEGVTVVSVGYGTLNKREVTTAITHVTSKDLLSVGGNGALMSLQGKVAGLSITNTATADPNSTPDIQLRGVSSRAAGAGPLYVINGVPGGTLENINQNDIESFDVLKGGAAAAIYGTRGSNGVIIITLKKGSSQSHLFYDGYAGMDNITNSLSVLNRDEFLAHNRGVDAGGNTDWLKAVSNNPAYSTKHTLQFSGGSGKTNYLGSVDYRKADGIDLRAQKEEYGGRVNINHTSANNLYSINVSIAPRYATVRNADYSAFNYALTLNPTLSPYDSAGRYAYINTGFFANNPVENAKVNLSAQDQKFLDMTGSFKLNLLPNLYTQVTLGSSTQSFRNYSFTPSTYTYTQVSHGGTGRNSASQSLDENNFKSFEWIGNYSAHIKKHSATLVGGYSYQYFMSSGFSASNQNMPNDAYTYNNLGVGLWNLEENVNGVGSYKNDSKTIAFFGRLNYDFDKKYFLAASLRREGSSKFGTDNKWGYFPAASAAWRIDAENFMKGVNWINELKLRADYGQSGNQNFANYKSLSIYSGFGYYWYNGTYYQVYGPGQNTNFDLRWEKAEDFNIGVDFALFKNVLSGSLNYYRRTNKDLLGDYNVPVPPNPQPTTTLNVGTMRNSGFEVQLNAIVIRKKDFNYNIAFAGATNNNVFVSFSNKEFFGNNYQDMAGLPAPGSPGNIQRLQEGQRVGSFYGYKSAGVDKDGNLLIYDKDNNIITADKGNQDDKRFIGNGLPRFTASLTNTLTYKNWDLSVFFRGAFDYDIFNTTAFYLGTPATQQNANVLTSAYDPKSKYSKLVNGSTAFAPSDYFLEPGSFVKLDNVSLGYRQAINTKYLNSLRVYVTGRNLHTFTGFKGGDPDLVQVNGLAPGVNTSLSYYPATLQLLFGLQLNF